MDAYKMGLLALWDLCILGEGLLLRFLPRIGVAGAEATWSRAEVDKLPPDSKGDEIFQYAIDRKYS